MICYIIYNDDHSIAKLIQGSAEQALESFKQVPVGTKYSQVTSYIGAISLAPAYGELKVLTR